MSLLLAGAGYPRRTCQFSQRMSAIRVMRKGLGHRQTGRLAKVRSRPETRR